MTLWLLPKNLHELDNVLKWAHTEDFDNVNVVEMTYHGTSLFVLAMRFLSVRSSLTQSSRGEKICIVYACPLSR